MDNRDAMGSWLSGPRAAAEEMGVDFGYRGQRLGLPQEGPGSLAPLGRRFGALFVDWALCLLIAYGLLARGDMQAAGNWAVLVLLVLNVLTLGTVAGTPGKVLFRLRVVSENVLFRLRVVSENGGRLGLGRVLVRSVLLCVAIPALIWERDSRGLHDRLARAVQIRV
ncbi:RDD family protein [Streptomyces sp. SPB074]|uniref:RDD family protein n=1 Tax=Streptomyces sp. (strain SPB074) TaxID=465543 RepID=UPI000565FD18|nr:RDD family protein [Streptomyces sp. SPB074]